MSIKMKYTKVLFSLLLCIGCKKFNKEQKTVYTEREKDSIAKRYHQISDYFLQPSNLYRIYKDSAINAQKSKVDYIQRLSYSYKKVGDHIKAMEVLNKAVTKDTANGKAGVLQYRAWTLLYFYRDYEGTIRDVDLIEKITKKKYTICWGEPCGLHKGQALYKLGKYKEAITEFKKVNEQEEKLGFDISGNHLVFFYMGRCYAELGEDKSALECFEKAQKGSYNMFTEAYYQMGLIHKKNDSLEKALQLFEKAKELEGYKMAEPYIERFDEVFPYMIDKEIEALKSGF